MPTLNDDADWNQWRGRTDQRLDGHDHALSNLTELVGGVDAKLDTVVGSVTRIEGRWADSDRHRTSTRTWKVAVAGIAGSGLFGLVAGLLGWLHK